MKILYTSIHKILAPTMELENPIERLVYSSKGPPMTAKITGEPETALKSMEFEEAAFAAELTRLEGRKTHRNAYIVFEAEFEDTSDHIDHVNTQQIRNQYQSFINLELAAIVLSIPDEYTHRVIQIGDSVQEIKRVEPISHKPIISAQSAKSIFSSRNIDGYKGFLISERFLNDTETLKNKIAADPKIEIPISLLVSSLVENTNTIASFVSAWAALELFIKYTFQSKYKINHSKNKKIGFKDRVETVILSLNRERKPFKDCKKVFDIYKIRNILYHEGIIPDDPLPIHDTQKLAKKYIRLHLSAQP